MGFLERLFGKKDDESKGTVLEVGLEELDDLLDKELNEAASRTLDRMKGIVEDIGQEGDGILETLEEIEGKVFPEEVEKRIYKPVKTARPMYVKGMKKAVGEFKVNPAGWDIDGFRTYQKKVRSTLKFVEKLQMGTGRYLALAFESEVMKVGGHLNRIIDAGKALEESLGEYQEKTTLCERARYVKEGLDALREEQENKGDGPSTWEALKEELEERISETEKALESLKESRDYRFFLDKEGSVKEKEGLMKEVRSEVLSLLSPLGRLFRKYQKLIEGTREADAVAGFIDDPVGRFLEGEDPKGLLTEVKKALEGGHITIKNKEKKRVMPKLERALDTDFGGLLQRYRDLKDGKARAEREMASHPIHKELNDLEERLASYRRRLDVHLQNPPGDDEQDLEARFHEAIGDLETILGELLGREVSIQAQKDNPY